MGTPTAPQKRLLVGLHLHAIEFYRTQDGDLAQRNPSTLPSKAHHHRVDEDAVTQQLGGDGVRVERAHVVGLIAQRLQNIL